MGEGGKGWVEEGANIRTRGGRVEWKLCGRGEKDKGGRRGRRKGRRSELDCAGKGNGHEGE